MARLRCSILFIVLIPDRISGEIINVCIHNATILHERLRSAFLVAPPLLLVGYGATEVFNYMFSLIPDRICGKIINVCVHKATVLHRRICDAFLEAPPLLLVGYGATEVLTI